MKRCFALCSLLLFCLALMGQDTVKLNVVYEFTYVRDLDNPASPYKANMILSLGRNSSRYCSERLFNENDKKALEARKREQERMNNAASGSMVVVSGSPMLTVGRHGAIINEEVGKRFSDRKLLLDAKLGLRTYHVETELPEFNWAITTETKNIGGYNCQKATASYGGRIYEAWFTTLLHYRDGPWKLHGLPGLILEAKDSTNEIRFTFKELTRNEDPAETTRSFLHSPYSIKASLKDLNKARMAFEVDPEGVMSAQAPNARLVVKNIDDPNNKVVRKIKKYNAIER